ncbi:MAG: protein translocase subunit SecF [Candidatus Babeliaceae bacterium]
MIDFLKYRPVCAIISTFIFIAFFVGLYFKKFKYSVDFTGGTQVLFAFSQPIKSSQVIDILEKNGLQGVVTRDFSEKEILVRVPSFESDAKGLADRMKNILEQALPDISIEVMQTDSVGAGVGSTLRWKSLQAIIVGLILMLLYMWWRFWSFAYAVGNVFSLFHDAIVILAFFLFFDYEISLNVIGAILTILGYSINDTIVIFSRIRENAQKLRTTAIEEVVNISINETLRRTLLTSFATLLVVVALLLFGGEILRTLALALLVGIIFGTYSSIYIASPVMLLLYKEKH